MLCGPGKRSPTPGAAAVINRHFLAVWSISYRNIAGWRKIFCPSSTGQLAGKTWNKISLRTMPHVVKVERKVPTALIGVFEIPVNVSLER